MIKKILYILLILNLLNIGFSAGTTFTETNNINWDFEHWESNSLFLELENNLISSGGPFITGEATYIPQPGFARTFLYSSNTEDYLFKKAPTTLTATGTSTGSFFFTKYTTTELTSGELCNPSDKNSLSVGKVPGEKYGSSHQIGTPK